MSETLSLTPGDPGWDDARLAWNLTVDQRPAAVALPGSVEDVVSAVRYARAHGLRVAAQGTGHNAGPLGSLADTILVKTAAMRQVSIDSAASRMRSTRTTSSAPTTPSRRIRDAEKGHRHGTHPHNPSAPATTAGRDGQHAQCMTPSARLS